MTFLRITSTRVFLQQGQGWQREAPRSKWENLPFPYQLSSVLCVPWWGKHGSERWHLLQHGEVSTLFHLYCPVCELHLSQSLHQFHLPWQFSEAAACCLLKIAAVVVVVCCPHVTVQEAAAASAEILLPAAVSEPSPPPQTVMVGRKGNLIV